MIADLINRRLGGFPRAASGGNAPPAAPGKDDPP